MQDLGNNISISNELLGGKNFNHVFKGTWHSTQVVVRKVCLFHLGEPRFYRLNQDYLAAERENKLENLDHPNVIKLFAHTDNMDFRFFALEKCAASLYEYCIRQYAGDMPPTNTVLLHIVRGLRYVHSRGLAHRRIHPNKIMISLTSPVVIKLSDFDLCKSVTASGSYSVSGGKGDDCYKAPEILDDGDDQGISEKWGSIASDTFSAGLVFFYFLTPGWHLFGSGLNIPTNIVHEKHVNWEMLPPDHMYDYGELLKDMVKHNPLHRISLDQAEAKLNEMERPETPDCMR